MPWKKAGTDKKDTPKVGLVSNFWGAVYEGVFFDLNEMITSH